jgi:hypothetical protein
MRHCLRGDLASTKWYRVYKKFGEEFHGQASSTAGQRRSRDCSMRWMDTNAAAANAAAANATPLD